MASRSRKKTKFALSGISRPLKALAALRETSSTSPSGRSLPGPGCPYRGAERRAARLAQDLHEEGRRGPRTVGAPRVGPRNADERARVEGEEGRSDGRVPRDERRQGDGDARGERQRRPPPGSALLAAQDEDRAREESERQGRLLQERREAGEDAEARGPDRTAPSLEDERQGEEEGRDVRDRAVPVEEAVEEDERAVEAVQQTGGDADAGGEGRGAPRPQEDGGSRRRQRSGSGDGEEELREPDRLEGAGLRHPREREQVRVDGPLVGDVRGQDRVPLRLASESPLPREVRPVGRHVEDVPGGDPLRGGDGGPLVRLGPEVPVGEGRGLALEVRAETDAEDDGRGDQGGEEEDGTGATRPARQYGISSSSSPK